MGAEITEEELIECLEYNNNGQRCSFDEVMCLLADLCETKRARDLVDDYIDDYYKCFDEDYKYMRGLEKRIEELEERLKAYEGKDKRLERNR